MSNEAVTVKGEFNLDTADTIPPRDAQWFVNCLEYGKGIPGVVWFRPDSDLSQLAVEYFTEEC